MHFFNPAPIMKLVEVVTHRRPPTSDVAETTRALCATVGKVAVSCGDRAGFIVNALLFPYLNDAVKMLEAHYADRRRHRHRDEAGLRAADGPVRAARRGRQRRVAGDPARALPRVPRARASRRRRCSSTWSPPATSAARPSAASATTAPADVADVVEDFGGEDYVVRRITGSASRKTYTCPGCRGPIRPATPHVVAWPVLADAPSRATRPGSTSAGTGTRRAGRRANAAADLFRPGRPG